MDILLWQQDGEEMLSPSDLIIFHGRSLVVCLSCVANWTQMDARLFISLYAIIKCVVTCSRTLPRREGMPKKTESPC
jgi:hypothetical protein